MTAVAARAARTAKGAQSTVRPSRGREGRTVAAWWSWLLVGAAVTWNLVAVIRREQGGRTYAGLPSNWGQGFTVGSVPVFKYLESRDVDEVGYTLRTASLMTDPEYYFDDRDPSDYRLLAIHYLILPTGSQPPVAARRAARSGPYTLWTTAVHGDVEAGRLVESLAADRADIGARSIPLLRSGLADRGAYLAVAYGDPDDRRVRLPAVTGRASVGTVTTRYADLDEGRAGATVRMRHRGIAVLSASDDVGWTATVNGRRRPTRMVAPALVAVDVPAGIDHVAFRYRGDSEYPELLALCELTLALLAVAPAVGRRTRRGRD